MLPGWLFRTALVPVSALAVMIFLTTDSLHSGVGEVTSYPRAQISNGSVRAEVYLPDSEKGSYRGTRFDWSGIIGSLEWNGHEYFGQWYAKHDPLVNDAVTGPVDVFETEGGGLGYSEAKVGEGFVRIGVGVVERADDKPFQSTRTYRIVDGGRWTVHRNPASIEFRQELRGTRGFGYDYTKTVSLTRGKPELVISHTLRNAGTRPIETDVYNHGFFQVDREPAGPGLVWSFPWTPLASGTFANMAAIDGSRIIYRRELRDGERIYEVLTGYGSSDADHNYSLENRRTGAGVRISGDKPISKFVFWSRRLGYSPEAYVHLSVAPGNSESWNNRFAFYSASR